jgi:hypothetical protein
MTEVILSQGVVLVLLFTMHGHIHPIGGSTCPSGEAEVSSGGWALSMTPRGLGRGGEMSPEVPISPETSLQGSGRMEFVIRAASD